jgi:hypothetical protein
VLKIHFPDAPAKDRHWWLLVTPDACVDLCTLDPGFDVDLYVNAELKAMTAIWMGLLPFRAALQDDRVSMVGDPRLADEFPAWLKLSPFAQVERMVA